MPCAERHERELFLGKVSKPPPGYERTMTEKTKEFIQNIQQHFAAIDELTQVVIKGHLLLEEAFNSILAKSLYNPELLEGCNLRFSQKLQLVRAFCISPHGDGTWEMVAAINALRNGIAHSLDQQKRNEKFQRLKAAYLRELGDPATVEEDRRQPDHLLFLLALALCYGFIQRVEQDADLMNRFVGRMVAGRRDDLSRTPKATDDATANH